ncbi:hypothetical protein D9M69_520050 [compost metagenome]
MLVDDRIATDQPILAVGLRLTKAINFHNAITPKALNRLELLNAELVSYGLLPSGWDGEESVPADMAHIEAATRALGVLPAGVPLPKPMLSADGEVGLYWKNRDYLADIVIEDAHSLSLFIRSLKEGNKEIFIPSIAIGADATAAIAAAFKAV